MNSGNTKGSEMQDLDEERPIMALNKEHLGVLINNIQVGVVLIDAETHEIVDLNAKAEEMIGCERKNILRKECHEFICPAKHGQCPITDLGMSVDNAERILITWAGKRIPILKTVKRIDIDGHSYILDSFVDLTEHKATQEALRESEERFRAIFDRTNDAMMTLEPPSWNFTSGNPASLKMFGVRNLEDFISHGPCDYSPEKQPNGEQSANKAIEMINVAMREGTNFFEWAHKRTTGEVFLANVLLTKAQQGEKTYLHSTVRDISIEKKAEEALIRAKEEWERTFDAVPDLVSLIDCNHRIVRVNKPMAERLGTTPEKAVGCFCYEVVHGLSAPPDFCPHQKLMVSGKEERAEVNEKRLGGVFDVSATPMTNSDGHLMGCIHVARDITERKRVEITLGESEERFRSIFEGSRDGIMLADPESQTFVMANSAMEKLLGYSEEELMKMGLGDIHPREQLPMVIETFRRQVAGDIELAEDLPVLRKDGAVIYCDINSTLRKLGDRNLLMGVFRDVTEKKRILDALKREKEKAENYLKLAGVMFVALDTKGDIILINPRGCSVLGGPDSDIMGKNWFKTFIPSAKRDEIRAVFKKIMNGQACDVEKYENSVLTLDGTERIIAWHNSTIHDDSGQIIGLLSSGEDVTDIRNTQNKLQESETWVKAIFDALQTGVVVVDVETRTIVEVNPVAENMLGVKRSEIIGNPCYRFFHSGTDTQCPVLDVGMGLDNSERILIDRYGIQVPILKNVVRATMNGRQYLVESFIDLTNQKKSEQALRESELKYRLLSENSSDVIWSIDFNGKFLYVSPSVETLRGFTSEEVMKQPIDQVLMSEGIVIFQRELAGIIQSLEKGAEENLARIFELEQPCKDGSTVWTEVSASLMLDENGTPVGIQGVSRDITARRNLESAMKIYLHDLERYKKATVDRELKMIELKDRIKQLEQSGGVF